MLDEVISHPPEWDHPREHSRGSGLQRMFAHDVYHCAEVNETLGRAGLPQVPIWD